MSEEVERTDDGHHIVVDGRKWRATNPNIPDPLRTELVRELMAARRAVKHSKGDDAAIAAARRRVGHAKVALGERGEPWWEPATEAGLRQRIESAIQALLRARNETSSICPSDAARIVGSPDWRPLMDTVRSVGSAMAGDGLIRITQAGEPIDDPSNTTGPLRYRLATEDS